jgi:hypothetical protein
MLFWCWKRLYYSLLTNEDEGRIIERINSNETFVTYLSDNDE